MFFFIHVGTLEKYPFAVKKNNSDRTINYFNVQ